MTDECRSLSARSMTVPGSSPSGVGRGTVSIRCASSRSSTGPASCGRPPLSTISQSHSRSSSETTCEAMITVSPPSAHAAITSRMNSIRAIGSRLATGSSRISSGLRLASAMVSETCACCPPDSSLTLRPSGMPSASIRISASS
jgi:hypothetical protein